MGIEVLPTDQVFTTSPDTGMKECICSRCSNGISDREFALRLWPEPGDFGYDPKVKGGTELRYCEKCQKAMGIDFGRNNYMEDDDEF